MIKITITLIALLFCMTTFAADTNCDQYSNPNLNVTCKDMQNAVTKAKGNFEGNFSARVNQNLQTTQIQTQTTSSNSPGERYEGAAVPPSIQPAEPPKPQPKRSRIYY